MRVGCGLEELQIEARFEGRWTRLAVRRVPGDAGNLLIREVPLTGGGWEADLEWRPMTSGNMLDDPPMLLASGLEGARWVVDVADLRRLP